MTAPQIEETDLGEARRMVARLTQDMRRARHDTAGTILVSPGCVEGCSVCPRACAVLNIQLEWWTKELARIEGPGANVVSIANPAARLRLRIKQCRTIVDLDRLSPLLKREIAQLPAVEQMSIAAASAAQHFLIATGQVS